MGVFGIIITNPCEIFCSFKYVKIIDYDVVLNARKSMQVSSENVANMVPIYGMWTLFDKDTIVLLNSDNQP